MFVSTLRISANTDHTCINVSSIQGWHEEDGSWTPPPADWTCGLAYHTQVNISRGLPGWSPENYGPMQQGTHFIPCLFNETADFRAMQPQLTSIFGHRCAHKHIYA